MASLCGNKLFGQDGCVLRSGEVLVLKILSFPLPFGKISITLLQTSACWPDE